MKHIALSLSFVDHTNDVPNTRTKGIKFSERFYLRSLGDSAMENYVRRDRINRCNSRVAASALEPLRWICDSQLIHQ